mgnify:CR=1 FL=1
MLRLVVLQIKKYCLKTELIQSLSNSFILPNQLNNINLWMTKNNKMYFIWKYKLDIFSFHNNFSIGA